MNRTCKPVYHDNIEACRCCNYSSSGLFPLTITSRQGECSPSRDSVIRDGPCGCDAPSLDNSCNPHAASGTKLSLPGGSLLLVPFSIIPTM
jgi:hypothetical protein